MQGGATHPLDGYPAEARGVLVTYTAAPRERRVPIARWVSADGPFSAACYSKSLPPCITALPSRIRSASGITWSWWKSAVFSPPM
jgi:hypothetical protein